MPTVKELHQQREQIIADIMAAELEERRAEAAKRAKKAQDEADWKAVRVAVDWRKAEKAAERKSKQEKISALVARKRAIIVSDEDEEEVMSETMSGLDVGDATGDGARVTAGVAADNRCTACKRRGDPCFWNKVSVILFVSIHLC